MQARELSIHHLALKVVHLPLQEKFYREVLGLKLLEQQYDAAGNLRSLWFEIAGTILMLEKCEHATGNDALLALRIEAKQRQEWCERLTHFGVTIEKQSTFTIYFKDPEGNRLALSHYPSA